MPDDALRLLLIDGATATSSGSVGALSGSPFGPFMVERCAALEQAVGLLGERAFDAVLVRVADAQAQALPVWPGLSQATLDAAVVVWLDAKVEPALAAGLVRTGVQDVLGQGVGEDDVARSLRLAVERKRSERAARKAYATDLQTGLPNRQQLIEHMSQLLALRGREPAPMALLVLRVEGFSTIEASLGLETANVLRRKVAVRLRAAVRASDVVAALAGDTFALLLASTEEPLDADRVATKLLALLHDPFALAGQQVAIAASAGVSRYPADGADANVLMRRAVAAATEAQAAGRGGFANWRESTWQQRGAANDPGSDDT